MIQIIRDSEFDQLKSIGHAFFTRQGGVSKTPYNSLNCNDRSRDDADNVRENKRRALEQLNLSLKSMVTATMVHGNKVAVVDQLWDDKNRPEADAIVTKHKQAILASDSADCPIVLLADKEAEVIGLAHAGWRSARADILVKTVEAMCLLGANQNTIFAVIGPCITKHSYEVSLEFHQQFLLDDKDNQVYFSASEKMNHFMFDLFQFVKDKLEQLSLQSVTAIGLDTYINETLFFSCRRAYHRKEPDFGGHLSCIYFRDLA